MSALGVKRTSRLQTVVPAFDPKRTSTPRDDDELATEERAPFRNASTSVQRLKFDQNIRLFGCMSHQMRRIGIVPACDLDQPASLPMLV
jgi:hypothetical protein